MEYFRACRLYLSAIYLVIFSLGNVFSILANYWLSYWSNKSQNDPKFGEDNKYFYYLIFVLLGTLQCLFTLASDFLYLVMYYFATKVLHDTMLHSILRSTMEFFESTPSGRIINRFSKDIEATERGIPESFKTLCRCMFHVAFTMIVISISTPLFLIALVPIIVIYIFVQVKRPKKNLFNIFFY